MTTPPARRCSRARTTRRRQRLWEAAKLARLAERTSAVEQRKRPLSTPIIEASWLRDRMLAMAGVEPAKFPADKFPRLFRP